MKYAPEWVNLLPEMLAYLVTEKPMTEALGKGHLMLVGFRVMVKF